MLGSRRVRRVRARGRRGMGPDGKLTVREAAELLDIDRSSVLRAIARRRLPAERHGWGARGAWLVRREDAEAYKASILGEKRGRKAAPDVPVASLAGDPDDLLSLGAVAEALGMSRQGAGHLLQQGALAGLKLGTGRLARWQVRRGDLAAFMAARATHPG